MVLFGPCGVVNRVLSLKMLEVLFQHVFHQFGGLFASCGHAC